jgi:hypothetical protein
MPVDEDGRGQDEEKLLEQLEAELRRMDVGDYLAQLLITLSSLAFQRLGLTPDTTADRDLDQARLAVDAFSAVLDVWAPTRPADEAAMFRSTLHQMRMAFVAATAGPATPDTDPAMRETGTATAETGPETTETATPGDDAPEEA